MNATEQLTAQTASHRRFRSALGRGLVGLALLLCCGAAQAADFDQCWDLYEGEKWSEAASCFEDLNREYSGWASGNYYLGVCYAQLKKNDEALVELRKAMDFMADEPEPFWDPYFLAVQLLDAKGKCREAMDVLRRGEPHLQPEQRKESLSLSGKLHYCLENWPQAIKDLEKAGLKDYDSYFRIGVAHYKQEDLESASDAFESALSKNPKSASAIEYLTTCYTKRAEAATGRASEQLWGKAADFAAKWLAKNPNSLDVQNLQGRALMASKDYTGARKAFEKVLKIDPKHCNALYNLTQLHANAGNWGSVLKFGTKSARCQKGDYKRNSHILVGDALKVGANKANADLADDDVKGRQKAIAEFKKAQEQYQVAAKMGSSGAANTVADIQALITTLEEAIATIEANAEADRQNAESAAAAKAMQEKLDAARKSSGN